MYQIFAVEPAKDVVDVADYVFDRTYCRPFMRSWLQANVPDQALLQHSAACAEHTAVRETRSA